MRVGDGERGRRGEIEKRPAFNFQLPTSNIERIALLGVYFRIRQHRIEERTDNELGKRINECLTSKAFASCCT